MIVGTFISAFAHIMPVIKGITLSISALIGLIKLYREARGVLGGDR